MARGVVTAAADPPAVAAAARRIAGGVLRTPAVSSPALAQRLGVGSLVLKLETLQRTGSFKERGALNRLLLLSEEERRRGVITLSAGNHAQGVAYHAARLGIPATVVMPRHTPNAKVARTRAHGAEVVLAGETLVEAAEEVRRLETERGLVLVHPYDDAAVIAGQGTATAELLDDHPDLDVLVIPVGGGGLIAGAALAARGRPNAPRLIGVEVEGWTACAQRLAGEPVRVGGTTIAEGIAVRDIGEAPFAIIREHVERVLVVPETAIETAIGLLIEEAKLVAEGAGAAGIAAVLAHAPLFAGLRVGTILCGANLDARILANVLLRNLVRDGRLLRVSLDIPDRPGVLADIAGRIARAGGNIIEVEHQRLFAAPSVRAAELDLLIEARDGAHGAEILDALEGAALAVRRL